MTAGREFLSKFSARKKVILKPCANNSSLIFSLIICIC